MTLSSPLKVSSSLLRCACGIQEDSISTQYRSYGVFIIALGCADSMQDKETTAGVREIPEEASSKEEPHPAAPPLETPGTPVDPKSTPLSPHTEPGPVDLPDLLDDLPRGQCESVQGQSIPGADRYHYIKLKITDDGVVGTETLMRFANTSWSSGEGSDCQINWSLIGSLGTPRTCSSCSHAVRVQAVADLSSSNCPEDMLKMDAKDFEQAYDLNLRADGSATVHFARNGKGWAEGYHDAGTIVAVSDLSCEWY